MNNGIELLFQLQRMNVENRLLLSSIIVCYFARKPIASNYKLVKDFKFGNVKTAALPARVIRKFDDIDEKEILKKQYGDLIMNFIKTVRENIPDINLEIFLNNFNTLRVANRDFKISNSIFNKSTEGQYVPESNTIELSKDTYKLTINHELFHVMTTVIDKDTGILYCGFQQIKNKNEQIGFGLNEGYTQYLTEKYFGDNKQYISAYVYEKRIAEILETIIGEEKMHVFYFNTDLNGLVQYLSNYESLDEIYRFINTLDFLKKHYNDKYLTKKSKNIMKSGFEFVNIFLIKIALRKVFIDNIGFEISYDDIKQRLLQILTMIPTTVKEGNNFYDICSDEKIKEVFMSVISEFKKNNNSRIRSK